MMSGDRLWRHFVAWCSRHRLRALPAHPWTVAAYLRWWGARRSTVAPRRRLAAVARVHLLNLMPSPEADPLVRRTLRKVESQPPARPLRRAVLSPDDLLTPPPANADPADGDSTEGRRRRLRARPRLVRRRPAD